ncbi:MAG: energy transducer TonB [Bacteroidota bacterium]|nr:energy transducer TonB [Bacteroidota bacterium]
MKKIKTGTLSFLVGVFTLSTFLVACNTGSDAEAQADSIQQKKSEDSAVSVHEMQMKANNGGTESTVGVAKPNAAKAHGKGQIVFQPDWEKNYDQQYATMAIEMDKDGIYSRSEIKPSFPGGEKALAKFIQDNIVYPETALEQGIEGTVNVNFAVDENGKVYTPRIKGDREGYGLDEASLDVVSKMPRWNPGQIKGKNVKSYYTLPISFEIH